MSDAGLSVSVVIPAYRAAATIGRAVESVLAQTRSAHEVLVVDDGSPDDLAAALAPYGERVRLVRQANGGAASARNHGIDLATGELIAFLDADDYWEPHKLERQLAVLERYPEVGLTAAHFYVRWPDQPRYFNRSPSPRYFDRVLKVSGAETLTAARRIWTSTALVRRSLLKDRRFDTTLATAEDVDLWIRLLLAAPVYLIAEPLATGVLEAGSLSRSNVAADVRNMLTVLHRHAGELGRLRVWRWEAQLYREWAAGHLGKGEARQAIRPACRRLLRQPWSVQGWWIVLKSIVQASGGRKRPDGIIRGLTPPARL